MTKRWVKLSHKSLLVMFISKALSSITLPRHGQYKARKIILTDSSVSPEWWTRILFSQQLGVPFNQQEQLTCLINNSRCRTMFSPISFHSFLTYKTPTDNTCCCVVPFPVQGEKSMCLGRSNRQALAYGTTDKEHSFSIQSMLNTPRKASLKSSFPSNTLLCINCKTTCVLPKGNKYFTAVNWAIQLL